MKTEGIFGLVSIQERTYLSTKSISRTASSASAILAFKLAKESGLNGVSGHFSAGESSLGIDFGVVTVGVRTAFEETSNLLRREEGERYRGRVGRVSC